MKKFNTPQYQDTFRYNWAFEKYGDKSNFWLEVDYFINREVFGTRISLALNFDLRAENGEKIFRNLSAAQLTALQSRNYKLLNEEVSPANSDEDILKVTELYGYAPNTAYYTYTADPIQIVGIEDRSAAFTANIYKNASYDTTLFAGDKLKIELSDSSPFAVGDKVVIRRPYASSGASQQYALNSPEIPIVYKYPNSNFIAVPDFTFMLTATGSNVSDSGRASDYINYAYGTCTCSKMASTRLPSSRISSIRNIITYHTEFPQPDSRFIISNGMDETDTITATTIPDLTAWRAMVAAGDYINVQDSEVKILYPAMYQKTLKQTLAR